MRKKHCWNYFAFNQSYLGKGKIVTEVLLPRVAVTLVRPLHVSKDGQSKVEGKDQASDTYK